ncbi:hypothetical protein [Corynebacterium sp. A21]|uniref:hypothetical protein n=1 Tax=Corynebacterium sp. A21 TaxID=3457318 RepID=UPI003FD4F028
MTVEQYKLLVQTLAQTATREKVFPSDIVIAEKMGIDIIPYLINLGFGADRHEVMDAAGDAMIGHVTFITSVNAAIRDMV